jgi:hypothetical protein
MGIETALLGALGGALLGKAMKPKAPPAPVIQPPEPPPQAAQAAKAPDRKATVGANAASAAPGGAMAGNRSTFLTGAAGVDAGSLNLGKNTLLGQ